MLSLKRHCKIGRRVSAGWTSSRPSGCGNSRTRRQAEEAAGRADAGCCGATQLLSKNDRARRQARSRRAPAGRHGSVGAAGCDIVGAQHKMVRYRSRRPPDTELRGRLRERLRRFGYRRLFVLPRQQGEPSGRNRIYRCIERNASACASAGPAAGSELNAPTSEPEALEVAQAALNLLVPDLTVLGTINLNSEVLLRTI
jgi:hypothetical protein